MAVTSLVPLGLYFAFTQITIKIDILNKSGYKNGIIYGLILSVRWCAFVEGSRDIAYDKWDEKKYGSEDIKNLEVVGQGDLNRMQMQYIASDDGNTGRCKTVVDLHLPKPIPSGAYVQFRIAFQTKFPETCRRVPAGKRDFVLGGQWFPQKWASGGTQGAWNCHHHHADDRILRRLRCL